MKIILCDKNQTLVNEWKKDSGTTGCTADESGLFQDYRTQFRD